MKKANIKSINKIDYKGVVYDISFDKDPFFFATSNIDIDFVNSTKSSICVHNSPPDIDIDFMTGTDDITNNFLYEKYGKERVMSVGTFGTFSEKNTIKDVVRAYQGKDATGFGSDVFALTEEMPDFLKYNDTLEHWFETWPDKPECSARVRNWIRDPKNKEIIEVALKLQGNIRGIGQHAAGVVITPSESWNYVPTNIIASNENIVTAFQEADKSGKDLSALGILKLDRLKLETLNVIKETIEIVKKTKGIDISDKVDYVDLEDENLFIELRLGLNHGIFQFESSGMNNLIRGMQVEKFEELVACNALYRPGPMGIGAHEEFITNKFNPEKIKLVHPALEPILRETNGVLVFQEQLMFIADRIGGMGLGKGDNLRRYMDKASKIIARSSAGEKLTEEELNNSNWKGFQQYWNMFLEGAAAQGYDTAEVDKIKDWVIQYLGYSFNKCLTENHKVISEDRGEINMLDVNIGERVLGYNPDAGEDEFNPVKDIHHNGKKKVYRIKTKSGKILECTEDHKIMTENGMKTLKEIRDNNLKIKINEKV